jgi:adenylate cyclase
MMGAGTRWQPLGCLRGGPVEGIECANNAFRLNPNPPGHYYWLLGFAQYAAGHYQDTVDTLSHPSASGPGKRRILAAALAQLGRISEAQEEARKFLLEFPNFSSQQWGNTQPFRNDADRQHFTLKLACQTEIWLGERPDPHVNSSPFEAY